MPYPNLLDNNIDKAYFYSFRPGGIEKVFLDQEVMKTHLNSNTNNNLKMWFLLCPLWEMSRDKRKYCHGNHWQHDNNNNRLEYHNKEDYQSKHMPQQEAMFNLEVARVEW